MMAFPMRKTTASVVKTQKNIFQLFLTVHTEKVRVTQNLTFFLPQAKLSDSFLTATEELGLHISKCRGQGYNKAPTMKGQVKSI